MPQVDPPMDEENDNVEDIKEDIEQENVTVQVQQQPPPCQ
jgi:hypothetical protein